MNGLIYYPTWLKSVAGAAVGLLAGVAIGSLVVMVDVLVAPVIGGILINVGVWAGIVAAVSGVASAAATAINDAQNGTSTSMGEYLRKAFKAAVTFDAIVQPVQYLYSLFADGSTKSFDFNKFGKSYDLLKFFFYAIPRIPNILMLGLFHGASFIGKNIYKIFDNTDDSENPLLNENGVSFFSRGHYIENQSEWGEVKFGLTNMSYAGCGILATYNALMALGKEILEQDMVNLINYFESNGAVLFSYGGNSPISIIKYFTDEGYEVSITLSHDANKINEIGENSDTVIITAYNDKYDVSEMMHTVCITKGEDGNYTLHNGYKYVGNTAVAFSEVDGKPIDTLQKIIENMSKDGNAEPICVIGISNPK